VARCDDSVLRPAAGGAPQFIRRARGYTPRAIRLARSGPSVLATGAWLKNTVCITRGDEAFLSPHIGSLDNAATCHAMAEMVQHLCGVLDVQPQVVAHDLHPDFFSTRFAAQWAQQHGLPAVAVQHHHAHVAAVAAEHGFTAPLLGLALDGVGLGADGAAWGGELLWVQGAECRRIGHLAPIAMPGGDAPRASPGGWPRPRCTRGPGRADRQGASPAQPAAAAVAQMLPWCALPAHHQPGPLVRRRRRPAGRAADQRLRRPGGDAARSPGRASGRAGRCAGPGACVARWLPLSAQGVLDPLPLLDHLAAETDAARGAALFHGALAHGLARWVAQAAAQTGVRTVALGGGCFLNHLLTSLLLPLLAEQGLHVLQARQAPPNDGAISLGQAWVALCTMPTGD
jgi:hydrogenase maturation protein HypF